jgi:hypothetical protein
MSGFLPNVNVLPLSPASVTDASVSPSSVLIDSTVAMATNIIFQPSVAASGQGIYKTWAEVMAVIAEVQYPLTIGVSFEGYATTTIAIPAGSYDMKQATIVGIRYEGYINSMGLKLDPGAQFIDLAEIRHIMIWTQETTVGFPSLEWTAPVAPATAIRFFRITDSAMITNTGTQPVIIANSSHGRINIVSDRAFLYSRYGGNTSKLVHCLSGSSVGISLHGTSFLIDNSVLVDSVDSNATLYLSTDGLCSASVDAIVAAGFLGTISWSLYEGVYSTYSNMPNDKYVGGTLFNTSIGRNLIWNGTAWISGQPIISTSTSIYISNSTGNDGYTGLVGFPLKTFAEFINRYGISPQISNVLTITFLDATVTEDVIFMPILNTGGSVKMLGTRTTIASGTFTSSPTQRAAATNVSLEITDTTKTWAPFIASGDTPAMLVHTISGGTAWPIKDTGSNKVRLTPLQKNGPVFATFIPAEVTNAANADAYTLVSLTKFTGKICLEALGTPATGSTAIFWFGDAFIDNAVGPSLFVNTTAWADVFNILIFQGSIQCGSNAIYANCMFKAATGTFSVVSNNTFYIWGGGALENVVLRGRAQIFGGFTVQGKSVFIAGPAFVTFTDLMIQDWTNFAVQVDDCGQCAIGSLSGTSAVAGSFPIRVPCGVVNKTSSTWVLRCPITGADATVGAGFKLGRAGYMQGAPYSAGALLAETTYTFAHLDAAAGAGTGFGGGTSRLDDYAAMNG